jgi:hypothetical protein
MLMPQVRVGQVHVGARGVHDGGGQFGAGPSCTVSSASFKRLRARQSFQAVGPALIRASCCSPATPGFYAVCPVPAASPPGVTELAFFNEASSFSNDAKYRPWSTFHPLKSGMK